MKKLSVILLALLLAVSSAQAEVTLVDPYQDAPHEAAMTEYLAAGLTAQWGEKVEARHEKEDAQAVNAFLSLPAGSAVLVCSQRAMILSLQGYTDQDLREALLPAACVAASDSCFFASHAALEAARADTAEELILYSREHPCALSIARLVDAGPEDYLTLEATRDMDVDQHLYLDFDEAAAAAEQGAPDFMVLSTAMLPESAKSYTRLASAGLPGLWQGVFVQSEGAERLADRLAETLPSLCAQPAWRALLRTGGYPGKMELDREAFGRTVRDLYAEYVGYLTREGLFFYEE